MLSKILASLIVLPWLISCGAVKELMPFDLSNDVTINGDQALGQKGNPDGKNYQEGNNPPHESNPTSKNEGAIEKIINDGMPIDFGVMAVGSKKSRRIKITNTSSFHIDSLGLNDPPEEIHLIEKNIPNPCYKISEGIQPGETCFLAIEVEALAEGQISLELSWYIKVNQEEIKYKTSANYEGLPRGELIASKSLEAKNLPKYVKTPFLIEFESSGGPLEILSTQITIGDDPVTNVRFEGGFPGLDSRVTCTRIVLEKCSAYLSLDLNNLSPISAHISIDYSDGVDNKSLTIPIEYSAQVLPKINFDPGLQSLHLGIGSSASRYYTKDIKVKNFGSGAGIFSTNLDTNTEGFKIEELTCGSLTTGKSLNGGNECIFQVKWRYDDVSPGSGDKSVYTAKLQGSMDGTGVFEVLLKIEYFPYKTFNLSKHIAANSVLTDINNIISPTSEITEANTFEIVQTPEYGSVVKNTDGKFVYVPKSGISGRDSFTYQATMPNGTRTGNIATVEIVIGGHATYIFDDRSMSVPSTTMPIDTQLISHLENRGLTVAAIDSTIYSILDAIDSDVLLVSATSDDAFGVSADGEFYREQISASPTPMLFWEPHEFSNARLFTAEGESDISSDQIEFSNFIHPLISDQIGDTSTLYETPVGISYIWGNFIGDCTPISKIAGSGSQFSSVYCPREFSEGGPFLTLPFGDSSINSYRAVGEEGLVYFDRALDYILGDREIYYSEDFAENSIPTASWQLEGGDTSRFKAEEQKLHLLPEESKQILATKVLHNLEHKAYKLQLRLTADKKYGSVPGKFHIQLGALSSLGGSSNPLDGVFMSLFWQDGSLYLHDIASAEVQAITDDIPLHSLITILFVNAPDGSCFVRIKVNDGEYVTSNVMYEGAFDMLRLRSENLHHEDFNQLSIDNMIIYPATLSLPVTEGG